MKKTSPQYIEWAEKACDLERRGKWLDAIETWKWAIQFVCSTSLNFEWAKRRFDYCCSQAGVRRELKLA